ncbi:TolC family protein [Mucilaginibacter angelicae]|uniref:TolC family protein n=1 Tax=Mucilaginibacter angelicae TaxID=869718 RepID=A0ABV6L020_9SPHI
MTKTAFSILLFLMVNTFAFAQTKSFSLNDIIQIAEGKSTRAQIVASVQKNKYFAFHSFKVGLRPQLLLNGNLADFSRDYFPVRQADGTILFQSRSQNYSSVGLSLSQPVEFTGGTVSLNTNLVRFDDFDRNDRLYNGTLLSLNFNQPIFSVNELRWNRRIEPLKYTEAVQQYSSDMIGISVQTVKYYFDVLSAQEDFILAKRNLETESNILRIETKRIDLGTTTKEKILQIRLQLLKSRQDLSTAELRIKSTLFNLKSYIGIKDSMNFNLELPNEIPRLKLNVEEALEFAKKNRPEYISYKRRRLEAERDLNKAKKDRFKISMNVGLGLNNTSTGLTNLYSGPKSQQSLSIGLSVPILDWSRQGNQVSMATANLNTVEYTIEQEEADLKNEIINIVYSLNALSNDIKIASEADLIGQERFRLVTEQFRFGKVSVNDFNIAVSEKDSFKRAYISSLRNFWESYYQLALLTLHKFN